MNSKGKYIPPHLRKSSAKRPLPSSNDSNTFRYRPQYNQNYGDTYPKRHEHYFSIQNTRFPSNSTFNRNLRRTKRDKTNTTTLNETEIHHKYTETIDLEQYIQNYRCTLLQILSQYTDNNSSNIILEYCHDDMTLIPNTFDRQEFLKYWFIVKKGGKIDEFRHYHRVDLYTNYLRLNQRGSIASIKGYKPSKQAKLRFECKFIYHEVTDFMIFSFRSNGVREPNMKFAKYGLVYTEGNDVGIYQKFWSGKSNMVTVKEKDDEFVIEKMEDIPPPPMNTEIKLIMIDDGRMVNIQYFNGNKLLCQLECKSVPDATSQFYRVMAYNRDLPGCIVDITYLELSVIITKKQ